MNPEVSPHRATEPGMFINNAGINIRTDPHPTAPHRKVRFSILGANTQTTSCSAAAASHRLRYLMLESRTGNGRGGEKGGERHWNHHVSLSNQFTWIFPSYGSYPQSLNFGKSSVFLDKGLFSLKKNVNSAR